MEEGNNEDDGGDCWNPPDSTVEEEIVQECDDDTNTNRLQEANEILNEIIEEEEYEGDGEKKQRVRFTTSKSIREAMKTNCLLCDTWGDSIEKE